jgi:hypothetical protein
MSDIDRLIEILNETGARLTVTGEYAVTLLGGSAALSEAQAIAGRLKEQLEGRQKAEADSPYRIALRDIRRHVGSSR